MALPPFGPGLQPWELNLEQSIPPHLPIFCHWYSLSAHAPPSLGYSMHHGARCHSRHPLGKLWPWEITLSSFPPFPPHSVSSRSLVRPPPPSLPLFTPIDEPRPPTTDTGQSSIPVLTLLMAWTRPNAVHRLGSRPYPCLQVFPNQASHCRFKLKPG